MNPTLQLSDEVAATLAAEGVRRIADEDLAKASVRDLPILAARVG